jgi:bacillopeptidase F
LTTLPEATTSSILTISGFAEAGSTVQLYLRGISAAEIIVNSEGEFNFENVHLREGQNEIYTIAKDSQGNTSQPSDSWTVTVDTEKPSLTLDTPQDGERFFDTESPITVSGTTEEGTSVTVNEHFVLVLGDGNFETKLSLNEGENKINVLATDQAGNQTTLILTVNYNP